MQEETVTRSFERLHSGNQDNFPALPNLSERTARTVAAMATTAAAMIGAAPAVYEPPRRDHALLMGGEGANRLGYIGEASRATSPGTKLRGEYPAYPSPQIYAMSGELLVDDDNGEPLAAEFLPPTPRHGHTAATLIPATRASSARGAERPSMMSNTSTAAASPLASPLRPRPVPRSPERQRRRRPREGGGAGAPNGRRTVASTPTAPKGQRKAAGVDGGGGGGGGGGARVGSSGVGAGRNSSDVALHETRLEALAGAYAMPKWHTKPREEDPGSQPSPRRPGSKSPPRLLSATERVSSPIRSETVIRSLTVGNGGSGGGGGGFDDEAEAQHSKVRLLLDALHSERSGAPDSGAATLHDNLFSNPDLFSNAGMSLPLHDFFVRSGVRTSAPNLATAGGKKGIQDTAAAPPSAAAAPAPSRPRRPRAASPNRKEARLYASSPGVFPEEPPTRGQRKRNARGRQDSADVAAATGRVPSAGWAKGAYNIPDKPERQLLSGRVRSPLRAFCMQLRRNPRYQVFKFILTIYVFLTLASTGGEGRRSKFRHVPARLAFWLQQLRECSKFRRQ